MIARACIIALAALPALAAAAPPGPQVVTTAGRIEGVEEQGARAFLGIPYAAPPVGSNRWRKPRPVAAWLETRPATRFGHSCWQAVSPQGFGPWTHEYVVAGDISEDCLFLNVWVPARRSTPRPVLVWVHGGGFNSGSGAIPIYDGRALAARGLVVVTVNYRVGVFGFLQHPELTREAGQGAIGNYGLQDLTAALLWVKNNIAAFGGDPARVTIAGQSAGAMAVDELIASPVAKGLFARAIVESGLPRPLPSLAEAERDGLAFAREQGAPDLATLRAKSAEALQPSRGGNLIRFGPAADGRLLPTTAWRPVSDVPTLAGYTADEGSALGRDYGSADPAAFSALLKQQFGAAAPRWAALYPLATPSERAEANRQAHRDRALANLYVWALQRAPGRAPAYAYLFTLVMPGPEAARWGAFHSSEIPYIFGTLVAAPERLFTEADQALSGVMACYWTAFVATGRPSCAGEPAWPVLTVSNPSLLRIDLRPAVQPLLPPAKLALLRGDPDGGARPAP